MIPARMALRLRELRVEAAAAARRELAEDIHPRLLEARAKYTDYVEPVSEEVVATGDDGWIRLLRHVRVILSMSACKARAKLAAVRH